MLSGSSGVNSYAATARLKSLRAFLSSIAYRKWNSIVSDVSRAFLIPNRLDRGDFCSAAFIFGRQSNGGGWGGSKPLYGLAGSCREWYLPIIESPMWDSWAKSELLDKSVCFRT